MEQKGRSWSVVVTVGEVEGQGFVTSRWDTDGAGPARRLYQITGDGNPYLAWWVNDLRETDRVLHHFLETYDSHMEVYA